MSFSLSPGTKFACIAIEDASVASEFKGPLALADGLWVLTSPPFEIDSTWQEWLGSIQARHYYRSNLLLFASAPSSRPEILDNENVALREAVDRFFYGILLHGVPSLGDALVLGGANEEGTVTVRTVATLQTHFYNADAIPHDLDQETFTQASAAAAGIASLYGDGAGRGTSSKPRESFGRLRRGFSALLRGFRERREDNRLHEFVRSLEAVVMPSTGKTKRQFMHRCQVFAGSSNQARAILGEIYDLRSCTEHMNDWADVLGGHANPYAIASLRAFEAELLASHVYLRLVRDAALRQLFATDQSIANFWVRLDHEVRGIWGGAVDLQEKVRERWRRMDALSGRVR